MAQTNLQIPIETKTRDAAKKVAVRQGFSSLQEMIRIFLSQVADEHLRIGFVEQNVPLSKRAESRYKKLLVEKPTGKSSASVKDLLAELES